MSTTQATSSTQNVEEIISSIESLCRSINAIKLSKPGIFCNAMIVRPELTSLVRDATQSEERLYRISRVLGPSGITVLNENSNKRQPDVQLDIMFTKLQPQRVDGLSSFYTVADHEGKAAVPVPRLVSLAQFLSDLMSLPTKKNIATQYSLIPARAIQSDDPIEMCNAILSIDESLSHMKGMYLAKSKARRLKSEYEQLQRDLQALGHLESDSEEPATHDTIYNLLAQDINEEIALQQARVDQLEREIGLI